MLVAAATMLFGAAAAEENIENKYDGYYLDWHDEFEGDRLNEELWQVETGYKRNNELQYYSEDNVSIEDSMLILEGRREDKNGFAYTSGSINTKGKKTYSEGILEVRAKLPKGKGLLPAIWSCGYAGTDEEREKYPRSWPYRGEIDIMEMLGGEDDRVYANFHWANLPESDKFDINDGDKRYILPEGETFNDDFHIFALEWTDKELIWKVDGHEYCSMPITDDKPFLRDLGYDLRLNLAIGGDWPGAPDENTEFPCRYIIDWVRYYKPYEDTDSSEKPDGYGDFEAVWRPDTNTVMFASNGIQTEVSVEASEVYINGYDVYNDTLMKFVGSVMTAAAN